MLKNKQVKPWKKVKRNIVNRLTTKVLSRETIAKNRQNVTRYAVYIV